MQLFGIPNQHFPKFISFFRNCLFYFILKDIDIVVILFCFSLNLPLSKFIPILRILMKMNGILVLLDVKFASWIKNINFGFPHIDTNAC